MARKNVKSLVPTKYNPLGFNVEHRKLIPNYCHLNTQLTLTKSIYILILSNAGPSVTKTYCTTVLVGETNTSS